MLPFADLVASYSDSPSQAFIAPQLPLLDPNDYDCAFSLDDERRPTLSLANAPLDLCEMCTYPTSCCSCVERKDPPVAFQPRSVWMDSQASNTDFEWKDVEVIAPFIDHRQAVRDPSFLPI